MTLDVARDSSQDGVRERGRSERRTARLNMRLTPEALSILREASRAQNQDITSFVLDAALGRAKLALVEVDETQSR